MGVLDFLHREGGDSSNEPQQANTLDKPMETTNSTPEDTSASAGEPTPTPTVEPTPTPTVEPTPTPVVEPTPTETPDNTINPEDVVKNDTGPNKIVVGNNDVQDFNTKLDGDSVVSVLAGADYTGFDSNATVPATEKTERSEKKEVWKLDAKPTEIVAERNAQKPLTTEPDAESLSKTAKETRKPISELDETDQRGRRQGYRTSYTMAERIKLIENIKGFEKELKEGRELTEEEQQFILERHLSENLRFQNFKSSYDAKNLTPEDSKTLLDTHFKTEIDSILNDMKDENGKFSSKKLDLDDLVALRDRNKEEMTKEFFKDRKARQAASDARYTQQDIDKFKEENPNWTPELAATEQQRDIALEERDLLKEKLEQQGSGNTPTGGTEPEEETEEETPEEPKPETTTEDTERRARNMRRATIIARVVGGAGGVATGLLVAPTALLPIGGAVIGARVITWGSEAILARSSRSLHQRIENETDPTRKATLERRLNTINRIRTGVGVVSSALTGFGIGFAGSMAFRAIFLHGNSLLQQFGGTHGTENIPANTHESAIPNTDNPEGHLISDPGGTNIDSGPVNVGPEALTDNVLTSNGRVDLPSSAWDGNLANAPAGNLPGGVANHSNFVGGVHEMAPHLAETALQNAGISRSVLLENLGTDGTHQLLNSFVDAIQMGNTNPSLVDVLTNMNTPGAQHLLSMINK